MPFSGPICGQGTWNCVLLSRWILSFQKGHQDAPGLSEDVFLQIYGYGSIPMKIPFLGGWTSINPSYFDVNYRGTIGFDTLPYGTLNRGNADQRSEFGGSQLVSDKARNFRTKIQALVVLHLGIVFNMQKVPKRNAARVWRRWMCALLRSGACGLFPGFYEMFTTLGVADRHEIVHQTWIFLDSQGFWLLNKSVQSSSIYDFLRIFGFQTILRHTSTFFLHSVFWPTNQFLTGYLSTPTPQPPRNCCRLWRHSSSRNTERPLCGPSCPIRAPASSFFSLFLSLMFSLLLFSSLALPTSAFPSVHIVRSLTSKLPSIIHSLKWPFVCDTGRAGARCLWMYQALHPRRAAAAEGRGHLRGRRAGRRWWRWIG